MQFMARPADGTVFLLQVKMDPFALVHICNFCLVSHSIPLFLYFVQAYILEQEESKR